MSQKSGDGYKQRVTHKYGEARRKAKEAYEHGVTSHLDTCAHEENLPLVYFLQEARLVVESESAEHMGKAYAQAAKSLRQHPLRIHNKERLLGVRGFGNAICNAVARHFWSDPECHPPQATPEELEAERRHFAGVQNHHLNMKAAEKKRKAEDRTAKKNAEIAASQLAPSPPKQRKPGGKRTGRYNMYAGFAPGEDDSFVREVLGGCQRNAARMQKDIENGIPPQEGAAQPPQNPRKRQKKAIKKEYVPGVGTANYAFMIALFQAHRKGDVYLTKHDLINRAEGLHITNKSITANANVPVAPGQFVYSGWNCFNQLCHKEPPLALQYGNPKKCKLTPEGESLAAKLYMDAAERQSIPGDESIITYVRSMRSTNAMPAIPNDMGNMDMTNVNAENRNNMTKRKTRPDIPSAPARLPSHLYESSIQPDDFGSGNQTSTVININSDSEDEQLPPRVPSQQSVPELGFKAPLSQPLKTHPSLPSHGSQRSGASNNAEVSLDSLTGQNRNSHTQNRLHAAWRLKPLLDNGSVEETEIRLPPLQSGECFEDRYEVALVLDHRERFGNHIHSSLQGNGLSDKHAQAVKQLSDLGVKVISKSMGIGDALWIALPKRGGASYSLDTIIERKRVDDLVASIKDQRYERQKYFLARCGIKRTLYVLEGNIDLAVQGPMAKACKTAMHRVEIEDGFRVLRTSDSSQTFRLYHRLTVALKEKYGKLHAGSRNVTTEGDPLPTLDSLEAKLHLAKKVTLRDVWGLMLVSIQRISSESCEAILQKYPTPISLWQAYADCMREAVQQGRHPIAAANQFLSRLPKIGPEASRHVFTSLFANGWQIDS